MYVRPPIDEPQFVDADDRVIVYGHRWGMDGPPEETYSVTAHPARFAPLHEVARALMAELGGPVDAGAVFGQRGPQTALRFDPTIAGAAPIVIALTDFPGVRVRAGAHYSAAFPACGCDACDEDLLETVGRLERTVSAITAGHLSEWVAGGWVHQSMVFDTGSSSGSGRLEDALPPLLDAHGKPLRPQAWRAWF